MANELRAFGVTGQTAYALISKRNGQFWNGTGFETYSTDNRSDYLVSLTEIGTASGIYQGNFPTGITDAGTYEYLTFQTEGTPAEGDAYLGGGVVDWTGTQSVTSGTGAMTASDFADYVKNTFKRDDKDTELYEAITDAVQLMRRRFSFDEAQTETTTADTISTLGDYRISIESDFGLVHSVVLQDDENASVLIQLSKEQFDDVYPDIAVDNNRGYPKHYCIYNGTIYIGPIPDQTSYTYKVSYSKRGGTVTSTTASVPFSNLYRDVLKDATLWKLYEMLERFDTANYHKGRFEEGFADSIRRERRNNGSGTFMVRPVSL